MPTLVPKACKQGFVLGSLGAVSVSNLLGGHSECPQDDKSRAGCSLSTWTCKGPKTMAQYPKTESIGSLGSIISVFSSPGIPQTCNSKDPPAGAGKRFGSGQKNRKYAKSSSNSFTFADDYLAK